MGRPKLPESEKEKYWLGFKPDDISEVAWKEIIRSWQNGLSDREAAFRASRAGGKVTEAQIRSIVDTHSEIADLREFLLTSLVSESKLNIADAIRNGDKGISKWYLERRAPEEFSSKAAVQLENAVMEISIAEKQKQAMEFLDKFGGEADGTGTD